jgi:membrane-bound lytic murein transglycosylase F
MRITGTTGTRERRVSSTLVRLFKGVSICSLVVALGLCPSESYLPHDAPLPQDSLDNVLRSGVLRVVCRVNPSTFIVDEHGPAGIEYELARAFASHLGVSLRVTPAATIGDVYAALDNGGADIAAVSLNRPFRGPRHYHFSSPYLQVEQLIVRRSGTKKAVSIADLSGKRVMVLARSAAAETMRRAQSNVPALHPIQATRIDTFDMLKLLEAGKIDFAAVNANELYAHQGLFPSIEPAFELNAVEQMSWATVLRARNARLHLALQEFLAAQEKSGEMDLLRERFAGQLPDINRHALNAFAKRADRQLPHLEKLLRRIGSEEGVDWRLLAAISYQESHWNPKAVSRTGVVGMMMLTEATAGDLGVTDRSDMVQSLRGGARYFRQLQDQMPADITQPDRAWFALAAYNMGVAHLEDARILAETQGLDPDRWSDVRLQLPLLARPKWYSRTRYGAARGYEAANFVDSVRDYHRFLVHRGKENPFRMAMNLAIKQDTPPERS